MVSPLEIGEHNKLKIPPDRARTPNNGEWNFYKIEQFQHTSTES